MSRRFYVGETSSMINDMFYGLDVLSSTFPFSFKGQVVSSEDYDLVPKKSYIEKQLKEKEQALQEFKERQKNHKRWADEQEKALGIEIDQLKQKLTP